jgi:hypothetical protein
MRTACGGPLPWRYPALVAQGIEHRFPKPCVAGPNPAEGTDAEGTDAKGTDAKWSPPS